jgi:beta-aspartyl-peptidase (threonine type)
MHVIAHGGAGSPPTDQPAAQATLEDAVATGSDAETPVEAVVATVSVLESHPQFNAGVGSAVRSDGTIRTDAGLMTDDRTVGAAAVMPRVEHAATVAELVATETPHVMLAGDRAVEFASDHGVETDCDLWTDRTRERWADLDAPVNAGSDERLAWVREQFGGGDGGAGSSDPRDHDTVGAVATDGDRLEVGRDPAAAAELAIEEFADITEASAGVIVMNRDGETGHARNTAAMPTATNSE